MIATDLIVRYVARGAVDIDEIATWSVKLRDLAGGPVRLPFSDSERGIELEVVVKDDDARSAEP